MKPETKAAALEMLRAAGWRRTWIFWWKHPASSINWHFAEALWLTENSPSKYGIHALHH